MGFKTTNYTSKTLNITLLTAYATIRKLSVDGNSGYAIFAIHTTRENSLKNKPVELVRVDFAVNRNESPYVTAYRQAKEKRQIRRFNVDTKRYENVEIDGEFTSWENDLID